MFGGNFSGGFLDWLTEECEAGRRPGIGQLAAQFEARYLGHQVQLGWLLEATKTLWEKIVVIKVAQYLSDRSPGLCCRQPGHCTVIAALMRSSW